jgi:hypothetical protein
MLLARLGDFSKETASLYYCASSYGRPKDVGSVSLTIVQENGSPLASEHAR